VDAGPVDVRPVDADDPMERYLRELYDTTILLDGYEAYVGNAPGNAQPCYGDSGGPLLRMVGNDLTIYGVTSGGLHSTTLICDYGAIYASFGPDVANFLKNALAWKDPCSGISRLGVCKKNSSVRCTYPDEGKRRQVVVECGLLGQSCVIASDGEALCAYPGEDPLGGKPDGGVAPIDSGSSRVEAGMGRLSNSDIKALVRSLIEKSRQSFRPAFARPAQ
jgi:hypothetical protein